MPSVLTRQRHREKQKRESPMCQWRHGLEWWQGFPATGSSESEHGPVDTLLLDVGFQDCERTHFCCLTRPRLWCFVTTAQQTDALGVLNQSKFGVLFFCQNSKFGFGCIYFRCVKSTPFSTFTGICNFYFLEKSLGISGQSYFESF